MVYPDIICFLSTIILSSALIQSHHTSRQLVKNHVVRSSLSMAIRAVENYDTSFKLSEESERYLNAYLHHPDMENEVCKQFDVTSAKYLDGEIFQPSPYSLNTPHGMPQSFEKYYLNDEFAIVNVPPVVMFKAKIFKPSRLCAIFRVEGRTQKQKDELSRQREIAFTSILKRNNTPTAVSDTDADSVVWKNIGSIIRQNFDEKDMNYDDEDLDSLVV